MKKHIGILISGFLISMGLVSIPAVLAPAVASDKTCEESTPTTTQIYHPAVTHVVHHNAITHTEWYYSKYTHTKTKPKGGVWSAYGPWTQWTPITHDSWETFNVEAIGNPAYHGSGTYPDGTQWYREWQVRNTGQTRTITDHAAYDETVIDSAAWTETVTTPGSKTCTAHAKTRVHVIDVCNCYRDKVTMTGNESVRIKSSHPNNTTWVFTVTGKKVGDTQYLLPANIGGSSGWAVSQTYKVHTKNQLCPCKKNHTCHQLYPNYTPPVNHCRGGKCN